MKILVLTKRQYMGQDLLDDRFGRFRELPLELVRLGHEVEGLAFSYRRREEGMSTDSDWSANVGVKWHSMNVTKGFIPRLGTVVRSAFKSAKDFSPDLIWACSDAYSAIFGAWLARRIRARSVIDLYDNFEAFGASKLPFVLPLFRRAVKNAHGVTCFSKRLAEHIVTVYPRAKPTTVIENGVHKTIFRPLDRLECRRRLGLPENATMIGTAGALDHSRGIETLFEAFHLLGKQMKDLHLALAGPRGGRLQIPTGPRVHDLNILPHGDVPTFVNAVDLSVVCYRQSPQGQFSLPQKAYEIIACRTPLIAAAVGSMNELLRDYPDCLYQPENPASLAAVAHRQLQQKIIVEKEVPSWTDSAKRLEDFFEEVVRQ